MSKRILACLILLLTAAQGSFTADEVALVDFSQTPVGTPPAGWKLRGTNGQTSRLTVQPAAPDRDQPRHAELEYDFAGERNAAGWLPREGRKTVVMGCWLPLPKDHLILELDLEGDGSGHGLVLSVAEAREWFNYDLGRLDFTGRKTLRVDLRTDWRDSAGPGANGQMEPPLALTSINVEQSAGGPAKGKISLHAIRALDGDPSGLSGLSVRWLLPPGQVTTPATEALRAKLHNHGKADVTGLATWQVRLAGYEAVGGTQFAVPANGDQLLTLPLRRMGVGYHEGDLALESGDQSRSVRVSFASVPKPGDDKQQRFGAGEIHPDDMTPQQCGDHLATMKQLGSSWAMAVLPFAGFDGAGAPERKAQLEGSLEAVSGSVPLVGELVQLPKDLVLTPEERASADPVARRTELAARYETALLAAARQAKGKVAHWLIANQDAPFLPLEGAALPTPNYAEFLAHIAGPVRDCDPGARMIACLGADRWLVVWTAHKAELAWPKQTGLRADADLGRAKRLGETADKVRLLAGRLRDAGIEAGTWETVDAGRLDCPAWHPGRQFAEGLVAELTECAFALPTGHWRYRPHAGQPQDGALVALDGGATPAGVAFAVCTALLRGAEPEREIAQDHFRGYVFRCPQGRVAVLWPQPLDAEVKLPIRAERPVECFGAGEQFGDVPAGAREVALRPGANFLRGQFTLDDAAPH